MLTGKVRRLLVRPIQSADLAFVVPGILDQQDLDASALGAIVTDHSANLAALYGALGETLPVPSGAEDPALFLARLKWDSAALENHLRPMMFFSLRAENLKASLDEAIADRENTFLDRFARQADIIDEIGDLYPTTETPNTKLGRLRAVVTANEQRHGELLDAYRDMRRLGAVRASITSTDSLTDSEGRSLGTTLSNSRTVAGSTSHANNDSTTTESGTQLNTSTATAQSNTASKLFGISQAETTTVVKQNTTRDAATGAPVDTPDSDPPAPAVFVPAEQHVNPVVVSLPQTYDGTNWVEAKVAVPEAQVTTSTSSTSGRGTSEGRAITSGTTSATGTATTTDSSRGESTVTNEGTSRTSQASTTVLEEFRHPSAENEIRFQRAQLDLQDEILTHSTFSKKVKYLKVLFDNQLRMLDLRVRQLQLAFINTFLIAPIGGFVTAAYKDKGESIAPGEPILRVENHNEILLVGRVQVRGLVRLNDEVVISLSDIFEAGGDVTTLTGNVVSVRGHDFDNDEWDLIIRCPNTPDGATEPFILPINYSFDYNDVTMTIGS